MDILGPILLPSNRIRDNKAGTGDLVATISAKPTEGLLLTHVSASLDAPQNVLLEILVNDIVEFSWYVDTVVNFSPVFPPSFPPGTTITARLTNPTGNATLNIGGLSVANWRWGEG